MELTYARSTGPGSQPGEEDGAAPDCLDMPREIDAYRAPTLPEPEQVRALAGAMQALDWLQQTLDSYRPGAGPASADISALDADNRDLVNQVLGEGEVSVRHDGAVNARVQESVLAGVWRTFYLDDEARPVRDVLEVGDLPLLARVPGDAAVRTLAEPSAAPLPPDVINAAPILSEVRERLRVYEQGQPAHVVNLTLLPLTDADRAFLEDALAQGPVVILSRGYGDCRITSTAVANVWWVRYYNSTGKLILDTLEVVDVPIVARAAPEDLTESGVRLRELLEPYAELRQPPTTSHEATHTGDAPR